MKTYTIVCKSEESVKQLMKRMFKMFEEDILYIDDKEMEICTDDDMLYKFVTIQPENMIVNESVIINEDTMDSIIDDLGKILI